MKKRSKEEKYPGKIQPTIVGPYESVPLGEGPEINAKSLLDRLYDEELKGEIKILPPELVKEIKKLSSSIREEEMEAVYEYLERLIQDGEDFEEALKKTYENVYPLEVNNES